ncbi:MAG: dihydrolipoyl dehydrogenase [Candidatus Marinimicrobia bacterium]|nr:dihydrolipoyl dehydrogenase [Candidatus Neomarinimicrobiota bacterium]
MVENKHWDVVVVGAGPGGYAAAFRASDLGKKVLLIDRDKALGGVCLNRGCIPSKALLHISKVIDDANHLSSVGVVFDAPNIDLEKIRSYKNKIITQLNTGIAQLAKARKVEFLCGAASFLSNNQLLVKDKKISFENCIIASGSTSSMIPNLPDHPSILTSRTALNLDCIPGSLLVIGGGVIGLELGQVYSALGSKVSVVEFMSELIPGADTDITKPLVRKLKKQFESIMLSSKVVKVEALDNGELKVFIENKKETNTYVFERVLVAVGRKPNTDLLNIENTDVKIDENGFISVDVYQRTSVKNIYAIGDIVGNPMLAHKATHEGKVAAEVVSGLSSAMDARAIPSVVYTDPEIAWVGLTENEAQEQGIKYELGEFPWAASGKAMILNASQGKTKILFDPETKHVLGGGVVGPSAGDIISEIALALEMGSDAEDISLTVHPHPTLGETVASAAEMFEGTITDLFIPKKKKKND